MGMLERFLGTRGEDMDSAALRRKLSEAERERDAAIEAVEEAERRYRGSLLAESSAETAAARAEVTDAEIRRDRAVALVHATSKRLEDRVEQEIEAERRAAHESALLKKAAAIAALRQNYRRHAEAIRDLLGQVAEAELEVARANEDLPADATPIQGVEATLRDLPSVPARVVARHLDDELWCYSGESTVSGWPSVVSEDLVRHIKKTGRRTGTLEGPSGRVQHVVKRRKFKVEKLAHAQGVSAVPLAFSVSLPGLAPGEEAVWFGRPQSASEVLEAVAQSRAAERVAPKDPRILDQPTWDFEWGPEPTDADGDDDAGTDA